MTQSNEKLADVDALTVFDCAVENGPTRIDEGGSEYITIQLYQDEVEIIAKALERAKADLADGEGEKHCTDCPYVTGCAGGCPDGSKFRATPQPNKEPVETELNFTADEMNWDLVGRPTLIAVRDGKPALWPQPDADYEIIIRSALKGGRDE